MLENLCNLFDVSSMEIHGQAVLIPQLGKLPNLGHRKNFSAFEILPFAPSVNPFFRTEEKHGCSGEGQVIVPAGEGQREMNPQFAQGGVLAAGDGG